MAIAGLGHLIGDTNQRSIGLPQVLAFQRYQEKVTWANCRRRLIRRSVLLFQAARRLESFLQNSYLGQDCSIRSSFEIKLVQTIAYAEDAQLPGRKT